MRGSWVHKKYFTFRIFRNSFGLFSGWNLDDFHHSTKYAECCNPQGLGFYTSHIAMSDHIVRVFSTGKRFQASRILTVRTAGALRRSSAFVWETNRKKTTSPVKTFITLMCLRCRCCGPACLMLPLPVDGLDSLSVPAVGILGDFNGSWLEDRRLSSKIRNHSLKFGQRVVCERCAISYLKCMFTKKEI